MPTARICEEFLRADPARGEASPRSYASSPHSRRASSISSVRQASGDRDMAGGRAALLGTPDARANSHCMRSRVVGSGVQAPW